MSSWSDCVEYLNKPFVKACILRQYTDKNGIVSREAGVIGAGTTIRFMHLSSWQSIEFVYANFIVPNHYNLYQSIALVNMPKISSDRKKKKEQQEDFRQNFHKYFFGWDFCIDLDASDMNLAMRAANKIKNVFDEFKMPYSVKNSGVRGFHFVIPWEYFKDIAKSPHKFFASCGTLAKNLAKHCGVPFGENGIDPFLYRNPRQLWKTAYSIDTKSLRVCLPLDDNQFENFDMEIVKPENVLSNIRLITGKDDKGRPMNRDLLVRNKDCQPKTIEKFLEEFLPEGIETSRYVGRPAKQKELDYETGVMK